MVCCQRALVIVNLSNLIYRVVLCIWILTTLLPMPVCKHRVWYIDMQLDYSFIPFCAVCIFIFSYHEFNDVAIAMHELAYFLQWKSLAFFVDYFATVKVFGEFLHVNTMKACTAGNHKKVFLGMKVKTWNSKTFSLRIISIGIWYSLPTLNMFV